MQGKRSTRLLSNPVRSARLTPLQLRTLLERTLDGIGSPEQLVVRCELPLLHRVDEVSPRQMAIVGIAELRVVAAIIFKSAV